MCNNLFSGGDKYAIENTFHIYYGCYLDENSTTQNEYWETSLREDKFKDYLLEWILENRKMDTGACVPIPSSQKTHDFGFHNGDGFLQICGEAKSAGSGPQDETEKVYLGVIRALSKYPYSVGILYAKSNIEIHECEKKADFIDAVKRSVTLPHTSGKEYSDATCSLIEHFVYIYKNLAKKNPREAKF